MNHRLEDLVVLMYAPNECYTQVVEAKGAEVKGLEISPEKGIWSFQKWRDVPIGRMRMLTLPTDGPYEHRFGVIGVYDRTKIEHLDSMVSHGKEATANEQDSEYA